MRLVVILLMSIVCVCCRTTSETSSREAKINNQTWEYSEMQKQSASAILDSILSRYKATIRKIERNYSIPDTAGNQYIISETESDIELNQETTNIINHSQNTDINVFDNKKEIETGQQTEYQNKEIDSHIFKPPKWLIVALLILIVILYKYRKFFHF